MLVPLGVSFISREKKTRLPFVFQYSRQEQADERKDPSHTFASLLEDILQRPALDIGGTFNMVEGRLSCEFIYLFIISRF